MEGKGCFVGPLREPSIDWREGREVVEKVGPIDGRPETLVRFTDDCAIDLAAASGGAWRASTTPDAGLDRTCFVGDLLGDCSESAQITSTWNIAYPQ